MIHSISDSRPEDVAEAKVQIIFGGTFDPVHVGHLRLAEELHIALPEALIRLLPCAIPAHRLAPQVSAAQRLAMLKLAVGDSSYLLVDDQELHRSTPSYTVISLENLRRQYPQDKLILLMGADAFAEIRSWHRWPELFEFASVLVAKRPGSPWAFHARLLGDTAVTQVDTFKQLSELKSGGLMYAELPELEVSATRLRELLRKGDSVRFLVPDPVINYIEDHHLYR